MILDGRTQFMTSPEQSCLVRKKETIVEITEGYRMNPMYIETKSKRVNLVLRPSLHSIAQEKATKEGISFNDYIHRLIESDIEQYEENVDISNYFFDDEVMHVDNSSENNIGISKKLLDEVRSLLPKDRDSAFKPPFFHGLPTKECIKAIAEYEFPEGIEYEFSNGETLWLDTYNAYRVTRFLIKYAGKIDSKIIDYVIRTFCG